MPYSSTSRLPASVRNTLPKGAQTIYRKAFENAWEEYKSPDKRRGRTTREAVAHKVAWSAVKDKYQKDGAGKWSTRSSTSAAVKSSARKSRAKSAAAESKQKSARKSPAKAQTKTAAVKTKTAVKAGGRAQQARWKAASTRKTGTTQATRGKTAASRGKAAAGSRQKARKPRKPMTDSANPVQQTQPEHVLSQQPPEQPGEAGQAS